MRIRKTDGRPTAGTVRSRGFTVALVGPDGAGKSTIGRALAREQRLPIKYVYLGINPEASNVMLPTTRLWYSVKRARGRATPVGGPPSIRETGTVPKNKLIRAARELKSGLRMLNQVAEEWYRQAIIWEHHRRGYIVLVDRHFLFDYYFHDIDSQTQARSLAGRLHGRMLARWYPRPDLVIHLDAPAAVLWARKQEGTIEAVERRRLEYLKLHDLVPHFVTIDAAQPSEQVLSSAFELIEHFQAVRSINRTRAGVADGLHSSASHRLDAKGN